MISALLRKRNEKKKREQQKASTDIDVPPGGVGEETSSAPAAQQHGTRLLRANEVFSDDDSGMNCVAQMRTSYTQLILEFGFSFYSKRSVDFQIILQNIRQ